MLNTVALVRMFPIKCSFKSYFIWTSNNIGILIWKSMSAKTDEQKCLWWGHLYKRGLTLIPAWISKHMPSKMWEEITKSFPKFNDATVGVWEWLSNFISYCIMDVIANSWWDLSYTMLAMYQFHSPAGILLNTLKPIHNGWQSAYKKWIFMNVLIFQSKLKLVLQDLVEN